MSNSPLNINLSSILGRKGIGSQGRRQFQESTTESLEGISEQLQSIGAQPDPSKVDSQVDPAAPVGEALIGGIADVGQQAGAMGEVMDEEQGSALALMKKYKGSCKLKKK
tara:strand:- start:235 stop:564 length:330 start_codon:yes stop_codon:yes gene_type:complete